MFCKHGTVQNSVHIQLKTSNDKTKQPKKTAKAMLYDRNVLICTRTGKNKTKYKRVQT